MEEIASSIESWKRRWARERASRLEAESIAERGLRELYETKERLRLLGAVAIAANEAKTLEDAFRFTLEHVCETSGWPLGHAYLAELTDGVPVLRSTNIWVGAAEKSVAAFQSATGKTNFTAGIGLPGRVLESGEALWISDLSMDPNFPRAEIARAEGIRSAFAFPVMEGANVAAVLEFFSDRVTPPDAFFLGLMQQVGTQLGRVVERKRNEDGLVFDASHDALTALPNRTFFLNRLRHAIEKMQQDPSARFAVLFIDLDHFKVINDSLGHIVGDEVLLQAAKRLAEAVRSRGTSTRCGCNPADDQDVVARLGGDEFTILLEGLCDVEQAKDVAERIEEALGLPIEVADHSLYVKSSIGIALGTDAYAQPADILRDADLAMYRAKSLGRSQHIVYDRSMHRAALDRLRVETTLHNALERNEFLLHYQPIVDLKSGSLAGFEALIRWQRSPAELIYPDKFITIAEETGLITSIGRWVLQEACQTMQRWNAQYPRQKPLTISVNLSGRQFGQADLVQQVKSILELTGLDPGKLRLEITESVSMGDAERTIGILDELVKLGLRMSLDDFGTGFSSLSYLHRLPIHILKVDRSFIGRMDTDEDSKAVVNTIMNLAEDLGMDVVAEGIELQSHVDRLLGYRCKFGQGYLFSRPLAESAAERLVAEMGWG